MTKNQNIALMSELNQFYQELPPLQYLTLTWPVAGAEGEIHYKLIKEKQQPKLKLIFWGMGNTESDKDQRYGGNFWHALYPLLTTEQGRVQPYYPVAMKNNVCFVSYPPPTAHSEENWKILI